MKTDLRILKTRRALKKSLEELLQSESFDKLTVSEICDNAYINRVTFYCHYQDKYELLQDFIDDIKNKVVERTLSNFKDEKTIEENIESFCTSLTINIIDIIVENKSILRAFTSEGNQVAIYMIEDFAIKDLSKLYVEISKLGDEDNSYLIPFIVGGGSKIINEWLNRGGSKKDVDLFKIKVTELIHDGFLVFNASQKK